MNKFTVEEINFMCVFETQNRMKMMIGYFERERVLRRAAQLKG